jgi:hypothetical protein
MFGLELKSSRATPEILIVLATQLFLDKANYLKSQITFRTMAEKWKFSMLFGHCNWLRSRKLDHNDAVPSSTTTQPVDCFLLWWALNVVIAVIWGTFPHLHTRSTYYLLIICICGMPYGLCAVRKSKHCLQMIWEPEANVQITKSIKSCHFSPQWLEQFKWKFLWPKLYCDCLSSPFSLVYIKRVFLIYIHGGDCSHLYSSPESP